MVVVIDNVCILYNNILIVSVELKYYYLIVF